MVSKNSPVEGFEKKRLVQKFLLFSGNILPAEDIYACMKQISEDRTPPPEFPLGVVTTTNRDVWAENRSHLESIGNKEVGKDTL